MKASVIIPTRDRATLLGKCLDALTRQSMPRRLFEVIVVDNGSSDSTRQVAESFAANLDLAYVHAEQPGLHVGRHAGARAAKSDILIFGDDDIVPEASWVSAVVAAFERPEVVMVGGNNYPLFETDPPDWLDRLWQRPVYKGRALAPLSICDFGLGRFEIDPNYIWGCNFSIRHKTLVDAAGFHPDALPSSMLIYRGDGESAVSRWVKSSGLVAVFDSDASVQHLVCRDRMSKKYFCKRYFAQGVSDSFTDLRRGGGRLELRLRSKNLARHFWSFIRSRGAGRFASGDAADKELLEIERSALNAYWRGYRFHSDGVRNDPEMLAWILKESYF